MTKEAFLRLKPGDIVEYRLHPDGGDRYVGKVISINVEEGICEVFYTHNDGRMETWTDHAEPRERLRKLTKLELALK